MAESLFQQRMKERRSRFESPSGRMKERLRDRQSQGNYDYLPRQEKSAATQLGNLAESGDLQAFMDYQANDTGLLDATWNALKSGGSSALDLLSRAGYAAGGAIEEYAEGNAGNIPARVGTELFSGVAGLKGEKKLPAEVLQEQTNYGQFAEEHPIASIATDFVTNVALDPSTYTGGALIKGAGKLLSAGGKGISSIAKKTEAGQKIMDTFGRSFSPSYLWEKGGAKKGYDIVWQEEQFSNALRDQYGEQGKVLTKWLRGKKTDPEAVKEFIRVGYGDIPIEEASPEVQKLVAQSQDIFRKMGRRDYRYIGADSDESLIKDYLPNRPMAYNKLMSTAGKPSATGYGVPGGFKDMKAGFQKEKKLKEGQDVIDFMKSKGVAQENIGEAMARSIERRSQESVNKVRVIRTQNRLTKELPETFRKLEPGTKVPWDSQLKEGESLWMPAGNLKLFMSEVPDSKAIGEILDNGGLVTKDDLARLTKEIPAFSTKVKVYAVPTEVAEALTTLSRGMGTGTVVDWWDKVVGTFKNTAILSPSFHVRNFISSGTQNYIAGVTPDRYADAAKVLLSNADNDIVLGKSVGGWKKLMRENGVLAGGIAGTTQQATGKIGKAMEPVFRGNRALGQLGENYNRATLFLHEMMKEGATPIEAAKTVKKFHFDYKELTPFERNIARRAIPFYTWSRRNVPLQMEMIFKAPTKYRNLAYLKDAVAGGKQDENVPDWWNQQEVWQTKATDEAGNPLAVSMGLPYADLNMLAGNPAGMLGPAQTLYDTVTNYDTFLDRPIADFKGQKKPLLTIGDKELANVNPRVAYALHGLAPILKRYGTDFSAELSRIMTGEGKPDDKYRAAAKFIGFRVLPNIKEDAEKRRVLKLLGKLREFNKYQEQEQ